jgi:hypothetical protein
VFNNPASLKTGLLAEDFPEGQIKYLTLDIKSNTAEFNEERLPRRELIMGGYKAGANSPSRPLRLITPTAFPDQNVAS